jgi:hypothetical protein
MKYTAFVEREILSGLSRKYTIRPYTQPASTRLHGVTSQKTVVLIVTHVSISSLMYLRGCFLAQEINYIDCT